jgi:hypothetical protein
MKKLLLSSTLLLLSQLFISQNLVINGDFETYSALPAGVGAYANATGWSNCGGSGSPDYHHVDGTGLVTLPDSYFATVSPNNGDAIMGLIPWHGASLEFREYVSTSLAQPLEVGQEYSVSFFMTCGTNNGNYAGYGIDQMGVAFTTYPPMQTGSDPLSSITPQFVESTIFYETDWQELTFTFIADSAFTNITFGNFVNDASTGTQFFDPADIGAAYYFLDDIWVEAASGTGIYSNHHEISSVYPNPFSDVIRINSEGIGNSEITVYNLASHQVLKQTFSGSTVIDTSGLKPGIYLYEINPNGLPAKKGRLIKY